MYFFQFASAKAFFITKMLHEATKKQKQQITKQPKHFFKVYCLKNMTTWHKKMRIINISIITTIYSR